MKRIIARNFTDGSQRAVYEDDDGRQFVIDGEPRIAAGPLWRLVAGAFIKVARRGQGPHVVRIRLHPALFGQRLLWQSACRSRAFGTPTSCAVYLFGRQAGLGGPGT